MTLRSGLLVSAFPRCKIDTYWFSLDLGRGFCCVDVQCLARLEPLEATLAQYKHVASSM